MHALVVEDSDSVREEIALILTLEGFTVEQACNGRIALDMIRPGAFDIVVCDVMMPVLDGLAMVAELRADPAYEALPVLFLTARVDRDGMREGMTAGADDYLTKPFTPEELVQAVTTHVERSRRREARARERLDELCGQLTASLPHELRTPLNGIIGFAEMLATAPDGEPIEETRDCARHILASAQRLSRLTENFLLSAQLELLERDPRADLVAGPSLAVDELARDVAGDVARRTGRLDDLRCSLPSMCASIARDALQKILSEVIDNAFKFSRAGTPVVIDGGPAGDDVIVSVTDRGDGIARDDLRRIGMLRQFDRARREQQGLGFGLGIAGRLLALAGGELTVDSTPGDGTTVALRIPVAVGSREPAGAAVVRPLGRGAERSGATAGPARR